MLDEVHEIALDERDLIGESKFLGVGVGLGNLVLVVVDADDFRVGKSSDFTSWSTDTASNVKNFHIRLDTNLRGEVVLVSSDSLIESFSFVVSTEMKLRETIESATESITTTRARLTLVPQPYSYNLRRLEISEGKRGKYEN